ncbi:hypothetical protein TBLA_0E04990 [Henningerozyma blattae CBS 6284]|uniref:Histone-lysine N-methyltransferase SET5 n=1 Tax=Henningerozyma blattae (strain ATCC 34711 / CBS 6284 / DSM 70876 / NBRC 10599 / NRRL Y-10934 / UCD 77-7) TaxID=1071380 RepID=I2H596_HENB6|nr:hypothetical protein TBLA_0E04990 [Tetrapisispora blattae CBS 6284]CCH61548.1 hypothetical protein TBLA_0E04990 [Tetrapisispora blattae CBS 6284]
MTKTISAGCCDDKSSNRSRSRSNNSSSNDSSSTHKLEHIILPSSVKELQKDATNIDCDENNDSNISASIIPTNQEICDAVLLLWHEEPIQEEKSLTEIRKRIQLKHPNWNINNIKDFEKILQLNNIYSIDENNLFTYDKLTTFNGIDSQLIDSEFPCDLLEVMIDPTCLNKGRGLYLKKNLKRGEIIAKDIVPIVQIPPLEKLYLIDLGKVCSLCGTSIKHSKQFIMTHNLDCNNCQSIWCSKYCLKNDKTHSYLNHLKSKIKKDKIDLKNWKIYLNFIKKNNFQPGFVIALIYTSILIEILVEKNSNDLNDSVIFKKFNSLATVSQKIRYDHCGSTNIGGSLDKYNRLFDTTTVLSTTTNLNSNIRNNKHDQKKENKIDDFNELWETAYDLFTKTFPSCVNDHNLTYEKYLNLIGRFNINQINGQLYPIASLINHNCQPNIHIEVSDSNSLSLTLITRRNINIDEELLTTYINPLHGVKLRRRELLVNWGFLCHCERCEKELKSRRLLTSEIIKNNDNGSTSTNSAGELSMINTSESSTIPTPTLSSLSNSSTSCIITPSITVNSYNKPIDTPASSSLSNSNVFNPNIDSKRRKSSMRASRPDINELLKNGEEFDLDIPESIGFKNRRTSVRFNNDVTLAVDE